MIGNNYIELDNGKRYMLDIDKIIEYCSQTSNDKMSETSVSEIYKVEFDENLKLVQKQIDEHKTMAGQLRGSDNLRYDFFRGMFEILFGVGIKQEETGKIAKTTDLDDVSTGEAILWNTMIYMGFLTEIK
jgi:hypothetical protein